MIIVVCEVESLPMLQQKEKKLKNTQNSDRIMLKDKQLLNRDRKKSEIGVDKIERMQKVELQVSNGKNYSNGNELKLPKVQQNKCR